jgi:hypothetical protein
VVDDCDPAHAAINSTWTLELRAGARQFSLSVEAEVTDSPVGNTALCQDRLLIVLTRLLLIHQSSYETR